MMDSLKLIMLLCKIFLLVINIQQALNRNFWEVFYEFSDKEKKQFLAFVTGSDRVPVGGLSKLQLIIVKNGPDSNR